MKYYKKIISLIVVLVILLLPLNVRADNQVKMHLFYGKECPHCQAEEKFFETYLKENDSVKLYTYEVWHNSDNVELLKKVQKELNNKESGVPYLVIGKHVIVGYSEDITPNLIKKYVKQELNNKDYYDPAGVVTGVSEEKQNNNVGEMKKTKEEIKEEVKKEKIITVPILGKINPEKVSLPLLAMTLGFVDGFNPCALWILIFLITMLLNEKNQKRVFSLGLTFILTSAIVYLLFMLTWLNLAMFISKISYIRFGVGIVALVVGIMSLSRFIDSLNKRNSGCDVVDAKDRKNIMNKIKSITSEKKFLIAFFGVIILAASVNIIELMCSLGLPLIFTQVLAMNDLNTFEYGFNIFIYILFFIIDDLFVFVVAMKTKEVAGISTKYTKYSHLVGGIVMVLIGLLLIIKPELLMFNL